MQCRKNYPRKSTIAAVKRQHKKDQARTSKINLLRRWIKFCFKNHCFALKKKQLRNFGIKFVRLSFKEFVLKISQSRSEDKSKAITARIGLYHDLLASEASYHHDWYVSFLKPTTRGKAGRPRDEALSKFFFHLPFPSKRLL